MFVLPFMANNEDVSKTVPLLDLCKARNVLVTVFIHPLYKSLFAEIAAVRTSKTDKTREQSAA